MQLDKTRIVVRERSFLDILDLAVHVARWRFGPLALALIAGVAPLFALNAYIIVLMTQSEMEFSFPEDIPFGNIILLAMLVIWQIPLATAPATLCLGQAVFEDRLSPGRVAGDCFRSLPQLLLYQVFVRGILIWPIITWLLLPIRQAYLNEVILLERNPLRQRSSNRPSTAQRCRTLHRAIGGDLLLRAMGSAALGLMLTCSFWGSIWAFRYLFVSRLDVNSAVILHILNVALWLTVGFFCVVRFLSYLDLRIRREGWEVELAMRAESERLAGPETM